MSKREATDVLLELADTYLTNADDVSPEYRALVLEAIATLEDQAYKTLLTRR